MAESITDPQKNEGKVYTLYYAFFLIQEAYSLATIDPTSDNSFIDTEAESILDFTETNPFGEPTSSI